MHSRCLAIVVGFLFVSFVLPASALEPRVPVPLTEERPSYPGPGSKNANPTCGAPDVSSAFRDADDCKSTYEEAARQCEKTKREGVASDQTCQVSPGMNKPPKELAACKRRQADEYDRAAEECIENARLAKAQCQRSQECVIQTDDKKTFKKAEEAIVKAEEHGFDAAALAASETKHVPIRETTQTGRRSLPELVAPNDIIHDSWHKANGLADGPAAQMKQHATQLRAEAARLEAQAVNTGDTTQQAKPSTASTSPAKDNPQSTPAPQQPQQAAQPQAARSAEVAKDLQTQPLAYGADQPGLSAPFSPTSPEAGSAAIVAPSVEASDGSTTSSFTPNLGIPVVNSSTDPGSAGAQAAAATAVSASAKEGSSKVGEPGAGRAPAASGGSSDGGRGGGGRYSFGASSSEHGSSRWIAGREGTAGGQGLGGSKVDLNQFLPNGVARSAALASMGIHGPHVNFFSKVNERYHSLENSLEP